MSDIGVTSGFGASELRGLAFARERMREGLRDLPSHFGWKLAGFLHYRIGLRGRDLRELGFGEPPSNGVKGFVEILGSEDRALGSHVRELSECVGPVGGDMRGDGSPRVAEVALDTVEGFETAVLEADVIQQRV